MEDNKNPKGAARSAAPLGRRRRRRLVVFDLVRISYVLASFPVPILDRFGLNFLAIPHAASTIVANSGFWLLFLAFVGSASFGRICHWHGFLQIATGTFFFLARRTRGFSR